jgi:Flp pilus assembly protein TadD
MIAAMLDAQRTGDTGDVIRLGRQARERGLADESSECLLGVAELSTRQFTEAAATFLRLAERHPQRSAYWNNLGIALRQHGQLDDAEAALQRACTLAPSDPQTHYNLGLVYLQQRQWLRVRETMIAAVALAPGFIEARLQAAHACHLVGDTDSVRELLADALQWPTLAPADAMRLAAMLAALGNMQEALAILENAGNATREPTERLRLEAHQILLHERCNQLALASEHLLTLPVPALEALPAQATLTRFDGHHAHAVMAMRARTYPQAATHYCQMLEYAADCNSRATAAFGLAAAHDRLTQPEAAWAALDIAHRAQQELVAEIRPVLLDPAKPPLEMRAHPVSRQQYARWDASTAPSAADSPIFVVGFPRSGTTLLEQMLDAHPQFRTLDERPFLHELVQRMEQAGQRYPQDLGNLSAQETDMLRAIYRQLVEQELGAIDGLRIVDKNPLNMLFLPMITRLFPAARIVLCLRHPCDVLLSSYFQPFRAPSFMAMCASPERLAEGYRMAFERWFSHRETLAPDVLEWRYEAVVEDLAGHLTALAQFLDIADPAPMAGFAEHAKAKGFIGTPSYAQVTESLHARSVGRWQAYRPWFTPAALQHLQPVAERLGYRI